MRRALVIALLLVVPIALVATACGSSDSADGSTEATAAAPAENADVAAAVTAYRTYVTEQVAGIITTTTVFTDAVRAGDIPAAKAAYAPSRTAWESIEPIASLVPATDGSVDFRVDDFASVNDPKWTGWHRLEYLLWEKNTTKGATTYANQLDADLAKMKAKLATLEIPPVVMARGASDLIQEVSEGKITGEEDRYSKTDLWDFAANVAGAERIVEGLTPALEAADPDLLKSLQTDFTELNASIDELRTSDGFVLFCQENDDFPNATLCPKTTVTQAQIDTLKGQLAGLSEDLALVPGALGLK